MPLVQCRKLDRELEGFGKAPWPGDIGQRIQDEISCEAWGLWLEHAKMLINEYRLNLGSTEALAFMSEQMEQFLFGDGGQLPPDFVPNEE